jgi:periplasmic protein TonB
VLTHGLVLCAGLVLLHRYAPPISVPDVVVAVEFVPAPAAVSAPAAPPSAEPAAVVATPSPPEPEPQTTAREPQVDQPPPLPLPTPPPDIAEAPAPPPDEQPAKVAEPKVEPPPEPRPVHPARPPRAVALHPPTRSPAMTPATASEPAVAAVAPLSPARPVAGMESDRPPVYPESARRRGHQGRVLLQVDVSAQGMPVEVSVAQSSGFASLDDAALRAVQQWRFVPATRGGTPVPAVAAVPVRFHLTD